MAPFFAFFEVFGLVAEGEFAFEVFAEVHRGRVERGEAGGADLGVAGLVAG